MAADDFFESEVALTAAATAAMLSPRVRDVMRQGAVYGLAGILTAGRTAADVARGAGRTVGSVVPSSNGRASTPAARRSASSRSRARSTAARSGTRSAGTRSTGARSGSTARSGSARSGTGSRSPGTRRTAASGSGGSGSTSSAASA